MAAMAPMLMMAMLPMMMMGMMGQQQPQQQQAPPPPTPAPAPEAPETSKAPEIDGNEPVVDAEAARLRADRRRKAAQDATLGSLEENQSNTSLTQSLLGGS